MKTRKTENIYRISVTVVMGIFAVCVLALLTVGIIEYKNIAVSNLKTFELRTSLSYIATKIRMNDCESGISVKEVKGIKVLSFTEEIEDVCYETDVYHYDGRLYEYYHEAGSSFEPENGFEVMAIASFEFEMNENGLLKLTVTDSENTSESMYICIDTYVR